MVLQRGSRHALHQYRFTCAGRSDDEPTLSESDRRHHVDDACGDVFWVMLQTNSFVRV